MLSRRILVTESLPLPIRGPADQEVRVRQAARVGRVDDAAAPEPDRADGLAARVVRGDGPAVPDGVPARVQRADLQPALRQRAGPAHRQLRPEDPPRSSTSGRARRRWTARWRRTRTSRAVMLEETPWLRQAQAREPGAPERRHPVRRQPAQRRDRRGRCASSPRCSSATAPGRGSPAAAAMTTSRSTSPPASAGCGTWACETRRRRRPSSRWTRLDGWIDEHVPRDPQARPQGREPPQPDRSPSTCTAAASSWQDKPIAAAAPGGGRLLPRPGPQVLAASWPAASRRATWPSR